ncbi:lytic murein transglycosylase B [Chitinivorax sp. B]|uniref:lytic murein transglycosylase B n=1 Tax=Chitinivorax sp. B TaxID=2502235 RepID=UPI002016FA78|nr:lytic murein transglycosylase B [Chitinivorax sp. B]
MAIAAPVAAEERIVPVLLDRPEVVSFIERVVDQHQFDRQQLYNLFSEAIFKPTILTVLDRPSTSRPWHQFQISFLTDAKVRDGVAYWQKHRPWLDKAAKDFGVPAEVIVAIIGVETNYGRNAGSFRAWDALTTIAFDYPRRAEYFQQELEQFLLLAREESKDPLSLKSSYAGALGVPQFMPSSFRKYSIDLDGDGKRDIWTNPADIVGSVAAYFNQFGWQPKGMVAVRAKVEGNQIDTLLADKFNLHYTVDDLAGFGVKPVNALPGNEPAVVFALETEPGVNEYWLGLTNFYAITRYNRSVNYAMVVNLLSQRLRLAFDEPTEEIPVRSRPASNRRISKYRS